MKAAACSWRVTTNLMVERRSASTTSRFSSPGTPKICFTPSFSSAETSSSAPFMRYAPFIEVLRGSVAKTLMGRTLPTLDSVFRPGIDAEQPVDEGRLGSAAHCLDPEPELALPEHPHHLEALDPRIGRLHRLKAER